jgi:hypothetical protein
MNVARQAAAKSAALGLQSYDGKLSAIKYYREVVKRAIQRACRMRALE